MILPAEFYDNPTPEQIEENIEFIDWSIMPLHLITQDIRDKFSAYGKLRMVIWLQEIFDTYEVKEHKTAFPDTIFFFKDNKCYVEFDRGGIIRFTYKEVFYVMDKVFGTYPRESGLIIKNIVNFHFGIENVSVHVLFSDRIKTINHFFAPSY